jgi:CBS domain-containing protein
MPSPARVTPLFAIDAVTLDTETTGLDPRNARLVEVAALRIDHGAVQGGTTFQSLVAPGVPIPATATAIHGITDADVVAQPSFREIWPDLQRFVGSRIIIGHSIGFDLAVLQRECARAGCAAPSWARLDTRLLAQLVEPRLGNYSLEALSAWLGAEVRERHRALADAALAAEIFFKLVPRLRDVGIRTLAEAQQACRSLTAVLEQYHRAGWAEPVTAPAETERQEAQQRLDSFPYRHRVRDLMSQPPVFTRPDAVLRDVIALLMKRRISSAFIGEPGELAARAGIVTERDLLRAVGKAGAAALDTPVGEVASRPVIAVPEDAFVYRAIGRMSARGIRHLAAVSEDGRIVGAVSARDLLRLRASAAIELGDDVDQASDVPALARAWAKVPSMARQLLDEEVSPRDIAGVIARELGALTRRAAEFAEDTMRAKGLGGAPCPYAVLVLGSAGRGESLLALDQDNAILFETGEPDGPQDRWFAELGGRINDILHEVGLPYCDGGVMARNPDFRGCVATWRGRIEQWIRRSRPEDLLNVDIFFDFRPVHGDGRLARDLWREAWDAASSSPAFLKLLAAGNAGGEPPIGLLGGLRGENGRIDLKRHGLYGIVASARSLALQQNIAVRSTYERLTGVRALEIGGSRDLDHAVAAHERLLGLILSAQIADIAAGTRPSSRVPLSAVRDPAQLKADLKLVASLRHLVQDQLSAERQPRLQSTGA